MENMFKRSLLSAVVGGIMAGSALAAPAQASGFFEDSSINGAMNFWMRDRTRGGFDAETGKDTRGSGGAPAMPIYRCVIDSDTGVKEEWVPHHICQLKGGKSHF